MLAEKREGISLTRREKQLLSALAFVTTLQPESSSDLLRPCSAEEGRERSQCGCRDTRPGQERHLGRQSTPHHCTGEGSSVGHDPSPPHSTSPTSNLGKADVGLGEDEWQAHGGLWERMVAITTQQGGSSGRTGVTGMGRQQGNTVKLGLALLQELFVQAKAMPTEPRQGKGKAESLQKRRTAREGLGSTGPKERLEDTRWQRLTLWVKVKGADPVRALSTRVLRATLLLLEHVWGLRL